MCMFWTSEKSHSTLLFSQFLLKKVSKTLIELQVWTSLYLQNFSHRNSHVKKILMENHYFFHSIENWKMSTWIMLHIEKELQFHAIRSFFNTDWSDSRPPFSNIFTDSFTLQEVFPFTESIWSQTFLSTLLHCLPTFIPLFRKSRCWATIPELNQLWCNPNLS